MSDIKIPGVNSDTALMVNKLMEAQKIPLTKMESDLDQIKESKTVWQNLNKTTSDLQTAAKSLYGFENPFSEYKAVSSKPEVLTATVSRNASVEKVEVTVKQKATGDRFLSKDLSRDYKVDPGTYTFRIGDEAVSLHYRGGKLDDFVRRLNEKDEKSLRASVIKNKADSQVLLIESLKTGKSNSLFFLDDSIKLGLDAGLIKPAEVVGGDIELAKSNIKEWDKGNSENLEFSGKDLIVKEGASFSLPLPAPVKIEKGAELVVEYSVNTKTEKDYKAPPPPGPSIPGLPGVSYKGIDIKSSGFDYNSPSWEEPEPPERIDDMNVFFAETDSGTSPLPEIKDSTGTTAITFPLNEADGSLKALNVKNNNNYRDIVIHSAKIINPSQRGDYEPVNPIDKASDAVLVMNGIEIVRDTNDIDDLVTGLTLNIQSSSPDPVTLDIQPDTEYAKNQLINFVYKYNELVTRLSILTNSDNSNTSVIDEKENWTDDQRKEAKKELGMFKGEYTLIRLKNTLQTIMSSSYETSEGSKLSLLKQIGISTNETGTGSAGDFSRLRGYLEINENVLDSALKDHQTAIRDLFGKDTNGDLVIDSGIGKKLDEQLTAYTQTGGFYSTKISGIDYDIDNKNKDISDYKEKMDDYEANLKRKYGNMESMLNQLKATGNSIDNFNNQNSNNN